MNNLQAILNDERIFLSTENGAQVLVLGFKLMVPATLNGGYIT